MTCFTQPFHLPFLIHLFETIKKTMLNITPFKIWIPIRLIKNLCFTYIYHKIIWIYLSLDNNLYQPSLKICVYRNTNQFLNSYFSKYLNINPYDLNTGYKQCNRLSSMALHITLKSPINASRSNFDLWTDTNKVILCLFI